MVPRTAQCRDARRLNHEGHEGHEEPSSSRTAQGGNGLTQRNVISTQPRHHGAGGVGRKGVTASRTSGTSSLSARSSTLRLKSEGEMARVRARGNRSTQWRTDGETQPSPTVLNGPPSSPQRCASATSGSRNSVGAGFTPAHHPAQLPNEQYRSGGETDSVDYSNRINSTDWGGYDS